MAGVCGPQARQGQARISRFDARFTAAALLYSPTCSLFSLLFTPCSNPNEPTNEGRLSRIPAATSTALPVRESDKSGTGKYIRRDLRRDFEESSCIPGGIVRLCSRDHHLWCIMDGSNFFFRVSITGFLIFLFLFLEFQSISLSTIWIVQNRKRRVWEGGLESSSFVINWNRRDLKAWWLITKFFFLVYSSF